jgi:hypothetical protein
LLLGSEAAGQMLLKGLAIDLPEVAEIGDALDGSFLLGGQPAWQRALLVSPGGDELKRGTVPDYVCTLRQVYRANSRKCAAVACPVDLICRNSRPFCNERAQRGVKVRMQNGKRPLNLVNREY